MYIYDRLINGELVKKSDILGKFQVHERTFARDIDDLRMYLAVDNELQRAIIFDDERKGYKLICPDNNVLTNSEVFVVCKILLESRSLKKTEMLPIIDKLLHCCSSHKGMEKVSELICNEKFNYLEPHHGKNFINTMWDISGAVYENKLLEITYTKLKNHEKVTRLVQPVGIMFSEYYFYLIAYISENSENPTVAKYSFPTVYRIDRIENYHILEQKFKVAYRDRFKEGEFRKRVQFMFCGELKRVKFIYKGISVEAVLDRLPTAKILEQGDNYYIISAEVYGDGIDMWLRSQGDNVEVLEDKKI